VNERQLGLVNDVKPVVNVTGTTICVQIEIRSGGQHTSFTSLCITQNLWTGGWSLSSWDRSKWKLSDGSAEHIHNVTCKLTVIACLLLALQTLVLDTIMKYDCYLAVLVKDKF